MRIKKPKRKTNKTYSDQCGPILKIILLFDRVYSRERPTFTRSGSDDEVRGKPRETFENCT